MYRASGWALMVLVGCGDSQPALPDAAVGPVHRCPPPTEPIPFVPAVHTIAHEPCTDYTESLERNLAVAVCGGKISHGSIGDVLAPIPSVLHPDDPSSQYRAGEPRLAPEGDELIMSFLVNQSTFGHPVWTPSWQRYSLGADDVWKREQDLDIALSLEDFTTPVRYQVSTPARRSIGRLVLGDVYVISSLDEATLHELALDGTTWREVFTYTYAELGLYPGSPLQLSGDGLRLVTRSQSGIGVSVREDISQRFGPAMTFATIPPGGEAPFLADDCSRMYFTMNGLVSYVDAP